MTSALLVLALVVKSAAFEADQPIPKPFTCEGADQSPRVDVGDLPPQAQTWAMIVDDPDAPRGTFTHWVIWNLPIKFHGVGPGVPKETPELPDGSRQGKNGFGKFGWNGPCPPPGKTHHYRFRVFALDGKMALPAGSGASDLERAIKGHVVAEGTLVGTYQR
ncbi:MAG TPA: YbhB/YbcL family Raf kinase inhibitor-like protein [Polyangia bacterium]|nr:YbhB/YbcL family Raf kinase inhibitor-like protein [Polyangia bacterium]